ncbi:MAG: type I secretion system permease/ATPase [Anaeromusa sp.]|uniref:peptidase domain-containing ABC transporter n=1 Tax=Anaeromusa sp. TaxID=1872520 RepID=UPI002B20EA06|nr:type I secretion system permease/ATPase [Anaeromusa sp.]MEA4836638.1 type I secretion system permease/ATPase [Anaeromusa sp.]
MNNNQIPVAEQPKVRLDTALLCLVRVSQILGVPADAEQLRRAYVFDNQGMDALTLIRAAKELGLKSSLLTVAQHDFAKLPYPSIALLQNGNFVILTGTDGQRVSILDPYQPKPFTVELAQFLPLWSGQLVLIARRFSLPEEEQRFGIQWFFPVILKYKRFLADVFILSVVLQVLGLLSPLFMQKLIDTVLIHQSFGTLEVFVLGMVLVSVFQIGFTMLRSYLFTHTTNQIDVTLSTKLFRHITRLPMKYFETWQVGDVVSRVRELDTIHHFLTGSALTVVLDAIFALIYFAVMFWYSVTLSVVALAFLPLFVLLSVTVTPLFKKLLNERFLLNANNQSYLIESITGIQTIKSMAMEWTAIQKWEDMLSRYVKTALTTTNLGNIVGNIGGFLQQLFNLAILWVGAKAVVGGTLSIGELIAFQMLAGQVIAPVLRLINMWQSLQQTMVSVDRVGDILNEGTEPAFNPSRTTLPKIHGEILLERVSFRYRQDGVEVLQQVGVKIPAGMKVGIVGRSGSGKSTLTKLIQRLYVPESGRVMIDGVDLAQVEPAWLRRQIGVVLQENFLFTGSIRDNIAIAKTDATQAEIEQAARLAGAHEFIMESPHGYDTPVGERGEALSGGQRQRIAIARALLINPSILIFDEATSALDYESERIILDNLEKMAAGRTMLMIAHRLSAVRRADVILVMDRGKIIECGNHEELLQRKGSYYHLHQQQSA